MNKILDFAEFRFFVEFFGRVIIRVYTILLYIFFYIVYIIRVYIILYAIAFS